VIAANQWLDSTTGRIATCPYSWMQAVHWVGGSGLYTPSRNHGPKWGPTTVLIAQEISALAECRPSVAYLARKLKLSERTVQYHLDMLREAGLLAYRSKGTRLTGRINQASVFERVIPAEFDEALGIRTVGEGPRRRPVGIAEEGRKLIGKLAKRAARKVRKKRTKKAVDKGRRCTPMQGGTSASSPAGTSTSPSETELASGPSQSPTQKKSSRSPKKLNKIGRRYQLARELISVVPWLRQASVPRIAWIVRHLADAGWTVAEVCAFLSLAEVPAARRPSGMLAYRLKGAHQLWATASQRAAGVEAWHRAEEQRRRHRIDAVRTERETAGEVTHATSARVAQEWNTAVLRTQEAAGTHDATCHSAEDLRALEDLSRDEVKQHRAWAEQDPGFILAALDAGMTEHDARRLYTNRLVNRALCTGLTPAF
jgi:DNA-binding transcriptional ArsR family regulator